jgi:hypothetical protein
LEIKGGIEVIYRFAIIAGLVVAALVQLIHAYDGHSSVRLAMAVFFVIAAVDYARLIQQVSSKNAASSNEATSQRPSSE